MKGWTGTILRVDLTTGQTSREALDPGFARTYAGGRGFGARILYDEVGPGVDPLGPDNKLIVSTGPCNGTLVPGSQRFTVTFKSPITGRFADSNSGGSFGAALKLAGYDVVIIEGRSPRPVFLWIDDDRVEIRPAEHLWGKTTRETSRSMAQEVGDPNASTVSIGVGGENLVAFASAIAEVGRALGRAGIGAVFGSKKLKGMVVRGRKGLKVADPEALEAAVRKTYAAWDDNRQMYDLVAAYGPSRGSLRYGGMMGDRNFRGGNPIGWFSMMSYENQAERYVKTRACFSCSQGCDHMYVVTKGPFKGVNGQGMELSQPLDFGVRLGLYDLDAALNAGTVADEVGLDFFDCSAAIAFAMECFEKGIITEEDTGGLRLEWGSQDGIPRLIEMIARREGIGAILAEGLGKAPALIGKGSEAFMIDVKGMGFPSRDPRSSKGWALAYAVSTRGPCHVRAFVPESMPDHGWDRALKPILDKYQDPKNRLTEEGKPEIVFWYENLLAFKNSLEICLFTSDPWMFSPTAEQFSMAEMMAWFFNAATGEDIDGDEVLRIGERIINLEKAYSLREGVVRADDSLPRRMLQEPMPDGFAAGQVVDLEPMISDYYGFRGWDRSTGHPSRAKLVELDLADVADELESLGKLAP